MSDLYEIGFMLELRDNLPDEVHETLAYMTRTGDASIEPSPLSHPFFQVQGYETIWMEVMANSRDFDEEMLGKSCGSVLIDDLLAFRVLCHEDPFWNTWTEFLDWLSFISFPTGLVGYYRNTYNDQITSIEFEGQDISVLEWENCSEYEELKNDIIEALAMSDGLHYR